MANWMTAPEIADQYLVGEARLLEYSCRGNLPMFRGPDGQTRFDEMVVAKLFRSRHGEATSLVPPGKPALGVLGISRLGDRPSGSALTARQTHRRLQRGAVVAEPVEPAATKVAG